MSYPEHENEATRDVPFVQIGRVGLSARAHYHTEIEVVLLLDGSVEATVDGETVLLSKDDILITMPGEVHGYARHNALRCHLMKLYADAPLYTKRIGSRRRITQSDPYYIPFREAIEMITLESEVRAEGYSYVIAAESNRILSMVLRFLSPVSISEETERALLKKRSFLTEFDRFLSEHYREPITLSDAAEYMHYSRYYFAHSFTRITGQTFLDYVTLFRLEKAKALLQSGSGVLNAAMECGFGSVRSLHRATKKYYGAAPSLMKQAGTVKRNTSVSEKERGIL